jgi:hypothetical protein
MQVSLIVPIILVLSLLSPATAASLDGLEKMGTGKVNYLGFIKVYDAELYSTKKQTTHILDADRSKCLVLQYAVSVTADDFVTAAEAILTRQHEKAVIENLQSEINAIHSNYTDVKSGDRYMLCYDASLQETALFFNNEKVVSVVSGPFSTLYFGIWLGPENPIDEDLRDDLLKTQPGSNSTGS